MKSEFGDADDLHPEWLFLNELDAIERAIRFACRRGALHHDEADDFASYVKLKLIDDSYAVIRKFERRSSFVAFISVVVQRMLLDYRIGQWGKWHASAQARRLGEPAITIEAMLIRDGQTLDEALPALLRRWPDLTREWVEDVARTLPQRQLRPRAVDLDLAQDIGSNANSVDSEAFESDRLDLSRRIAAIVRTTMRDLDEHDRMVFRLRYEGGMSLAAISRTLKIDQKPLYRRMQRCLLALRQGLETGGITAADANQLLESRSTDLDFGFGAEASPSGELPLGDAGLTPDEEQA